MPAPAGDHYDVLVIGSGPGGATTAARVAETGKRVLILERGDFLPRERDNWNSRAVFGNDWQIKGAAPRGLGWAPSAPYGEVARHSIDFWLSSEDIPLADSRVTRR